MTPIEIDSKYIWHPYTQQKVANAPIMVKKASGAYLYAQDGQKYFDAISSWWVNLHGHCHPYIKEKITEQLDKMEQIIFAGHTHEGATQLAKEIINFLPGSFSRVFFSDNGSTSVEIALKMALQYWINHDIPKKRVIAFRNSYHGDTFGARAVTHSIEEPIGLSQKMCQVHYIDPPLKGSHPEKSLAQLKKLLNRYKDFGAFIFEPLVQGVAGMKIQDIEMLDSLIQLAQENNVICIADEVMTGFGRTGKNFAIDHLKHHPDIICLAKGLTGGVLPLSLTVAKEKIYEGFLFDDKSKALLHGHSFTGNSLGCAAALASLELLKSEETQNQIQMITNEHQRFLNSILETPKIMDKLLDIRMQGTILALDIKTSEESNYFNSLSEVISNFFMERNLLLRPLGNTIYMIPPYCSKKEDLAHAYDAIKEFCLFI